MELINKYGRKLFWFVAKTLAAVVLNFILFLIFLYSYLFHYSDYGMKEKTQRIYNHLSSQTGQSQNKLPLRIVDSNIDNAYNNGYEIVIYTGLIRNSETWDEVALVLEHEIAHGTLGHLNQSMPVPEQNPDLGMGINDHIAILEANADKLAAVYMMKAGYIG